MEQKFKGTPPRLPVIFERYSFPLYFVTFNTLLKRPLLANKVVHDAFRQYADKGITFNAAVGRYVLMPDHVHLFVRIGPEMTLKRWVSGLKQCLGKSLDAIGNQPTQLPGGKLKSYWQPGFFDHLLRQGESYGEKWEYVRQNAVRAKLITKPEDWPYQGEIFLIDRNDI
jgi:putative transposase